MNEPNAAARPLSDAERAHLVLRLTLGLNIAAHGVVRVGHPAAFADALVQHLSKTILPSWSVWPFALTVPFVELTAGLLIVAGLRLRAALAAGGVLIAALTVGVCLNQEWEVAGLQLVYALAYFALSSRASDARLALDGLFGRPGRAAGAP